MATEVRVLHRLPGRVRVSLDPYPAEWVFDWLRRLPGVLAVSGSWLTCTVLIRYDAARVSEETLIADLVRLHKLPDQGAGVSPAGPSVQDSGGGVVRVERETVRSIGSVRRRRVRVYVQALDGNPNVAHAFEQALSQLGVLAVRASALTGRILLETDDSLSLPDLLATITSLPLPELPPTTHRAVSPFDRDLVTYGVMRAVGTAAGLSLLVIRQLLGQPAPLMTSSLPGLLVDSIAVLRGFPTLREGLRRLLTPVGADVATSSAGIVAQTLAGHRIGLLVSLLEALRLLSVLLPWKRAWHRYEQQIFHGTIPHPGSIVQISPGNRLPLPATMLDGDAIVLAPNGLTEHVRPGRTLAAGSLVLQGQGAVCCQALDATPVSDSSERRPLPLLTRRYFDLIGLLAIGVAAVSGLRAGSLGAAGRSLVLLNARPALIGAEVADLSAVGRALRSGALVTRLTPGRRLTRPTALVIDHPVLLIDGFELESIHPFDGRLPVSEALEHSARLALEQRLPFAGAFPLTGGGRRNGSRDWREFELTLLAEHEDSNTRDDPELVRVDNLRVYLRERSSGSLTAVISLRPRLSPAAQALLRRCREEGVSVTILVKTAKSPHWLSGLPVNVVERGDPGSVIAALRQAGHIVYYVTDHTASPGAVVAADLSIGVQADGTLLDYPVDVIVRDLTSVEALIDIGTRRDRAVRDTTLVSLASNLAALALSVGLAISPTLSSVLLGGSALIAILIAWIRLWGQSAVVTDPVYVDPQPERWGERPAVEVLQALGTSPEGLQSAEAARRLVMDADQASLSPWIQAALDQLSSPLAGIMAAGAILLLAVNAPLDVLIIIGTIVLNALLGTWQEVRVARASSELAQLTETMARVRRDGREQTIPARELVPGDVIVLRFGDLVPSDARLLSAENFAVDESALTGESIPVQKDAAARDERAVVLAGSAVVSGTAEAVVVSAGSGTRLGALRRSLSLAPEMGDRLSERLAQYTRLSLPISFTTAAVVTLAGILRGLPTATQLSLGASLAIAAVPEGLPLLSRVAQAGTARRLSRLGILVRRLSAVEALGRVSVVCVDKTGTMTLGQLQVTRIVTSQGIESYPGSLSPLALQTLASAALACPPLSRSDAFAHATDAAILRAASESALAIDLSTARDEELPFDSTQPYHAVRIGQRLYFKGSPDVLLERCADWIGPDGQRRPLDGVARQWLEDQLLALAQTGLRLLLVAEGQAPMALQNPAGLTALGLVGLSDPLRPTVADAVQRCRRAGVQVLMITGDHPATALTVARAAGLADAGDGVLTGLDVAALSDEELADRLGRVRVIARATPLDKVRIVRALQMRGHVVAMTGDGVNDSAALRLADVGMAMGWGTEVARQAADLILMNEDFAALVQALIEGRSFWRNMRRAVALLLGGNLGELLLMGIPVLVGAPAPLNTRQLLMVNLITDVPPALAIALQGPRYRHLEDLAREGATALDRPLRVDVLRRAGVTALPSAIGYLWTTAVASASAPGVAFAALVAGQLAQTLELGATGAGLTPSLVTGVGVSSAVLVATLLIPSARTLLGLTPLRMDDWVVVALSTAATVFASRVLGQLLATESALPSTPRWSLPAPQLGSS